MPKTFAASLILLTFWNLSFPASLQAQPVRNHVVPWDELQRELVAHSLKRRANFRQIQNPLCQQPIQKQVGTPADLEQVGVALAALEDETLDRSASESRLVDDQLQAGVAKTTWLAIAVAASLAILMLTVATQSGCCTG